MTFSRDIAPLVRQHCATCHRPGGAGPFDLLTYDDVRRHLKKGMDLIHRRIMPPGLPEPGFGEFAGDWRRSVSFHASCGHRCRYNKVGVSSRMLAPLKNKLKAAAPSIIPPLQPGDRLTRAEFERRFDATPNLKRAELIEGVVYMPPPVSADGHGEPHSDLNTWIGAYRSATPGIKAGDNSSLRLDLDNMPQPDVYLRILAENGGQCRIDADGYIEGAPEFVAEVAATSASYDLHSKFAVYRRNAVREYVVWRVFDRAIDYFVLREETFVPLPPNRRGILKSEVFPGLWLDPAALIDGDMPRVLAVLRKGLASRPHTEFVARLKRAARKR